MTHPRLRINGPDGSACTLGASMHLFDGEVPIGVMKPVVSRAGTEVHLEDFALADSVTPYKHDISKLVLLEMVSFIIENFTTVQAISFTLNRHIDGFGGSSKLATFRSGVLQSIGVGHIVIAPKPDAGRAGHFVVSGLWEYNAASIDALNAVLSSERENFDRQREAAAQDRAVREDSWVRRFFPRSGTRGDPGDSQR